MKTAETLMTTPTTTASTPAERAVLPALQIQILTMMVGYSNCDLCKRSKLSMGSLQQLHKRESPALYRFAPL